MSWYSAPRMESCPRDRLTGGAVGREWGRAGMRRRACQRCLSVSVAERVRRVGWMADLGREEGGEGGVCRGWGSCPRDRLTGDAIAGERGARGAAVGQMNTLGIVGSARVPTNCTRLVGQVKQARGGRVVVGR